MSRIIDAFAGWLTAELWSFQAAEPRRLKGQVFDAWGWWEWCTWASEDDDLAEVRVSLPVNVPEEGRARVAEYLTRVNWSLVIGAFTMDYNDGEVRYRIVAPAGSGELGPDWARGMMHSTAFAIGNYVPELLKVAFLEVSPAEALERADAWKSEPPPQGAAPAGAANGDHQQGKICRRVRRRAR